MEEPRKAKAKLLLNGSASLINHSLISRSLLQVTLSGNQQPVRTEITEAAMELGAEVSDIF